MASYIIAGGLDGRERLRLLSRVMRPSTLALLERAGAQPGMRCLEVACGGGDVAFDLARMVGPDGSVVGTDIDPVKLDIARTEAAAQGLVNVEFRQADILRDPVEAGFDLVHVRFLLTHLTDPSAALERMRAALNPGGVLVVEDVDFDGHFSFPDSPAFRRYVELYSQTLARRGGDAFIGRRLPALLTQAGFGAVDVSIAQPAGIDGEVKLVAPITMELTAQSVLDEGLATEAELKAIVAELYETARTPGTLLSLPRVVGVWAVW
ncbi:SAM-dependent methyltransferase [Caulobacter ginsengisoli]|uniref:SAM-dependent methyltransferase n=1 Tax=Caulobacter ginsengisoli TaxID=400775 RepID=A0ABU0ISL2_9CAUL|nr:methyltransferase domain-containing protein [Caulobacter ginsengisoli]MDQ0464991.1 SAM-dependent methyltransferase [Caulobacter ginsengisoli]